ncbi:hypothetical protein GGI24_004322, partial [Coemansia furcata]
MSNFFNYMVKEHLAHIELHAKNSLDLLLRRFIIHDLTKGNRSYRNHRRRQRSRRDGHTRSNGGGGQTPSQRIARRRWWHTVHDGNISRGQASKRAKEVLERMHDQSKECLESDWQTYGVPYLTATTTELRLKEVFNLNLKLRAANKGTVMLLPLFSPAARYITFDSTGLYKILLECERHNNTGYCDSDNGCNRCRGRKTIKVPADDDSRFRWERIKFWLMYFNIPEKLLLQKDGLPTEGRSYFNCMLSTDGFGASLSTFRWVRKPWANQPAKASAAFSGMTTAEMKSMSRSDADKKRKSMHDSSSSLLSTSEPSSSVPASSKPRRKRQRAHLPVSLPEQPPPPPMPTTELPLIDTVDPPDEQPAYTEEETKAAHALLRAEVAANTHVVPILASISFDDISAHIDAAADALAARRQQGDEDYAQIIAGRAAARKAATFDVAEIYREDRRTVISNTRIEEALIAYETTIKDAEAAAVRPLTEAATADLQTAYNDAMDAATYGLRVAHSIAMDVIDAEDRIIAATRTAMHNPNHVHIGGDPGVVTFCTFARLNDPKWRCSFSTKQYHADIGSTWRAEKMGEFVDKLGLRLWLSKTPTSKTVSSKETLDLLRYLYATDKFALHMKMHQSLRVLNMRWNVYERTKSTITRYCSIVAAGCTRELTTINMGDAKLSNMRGCLPCPRVKKMTDHWRRTGWRVVMIKEYNTSR